MQRKTLRPQTFPAVFIISIAPAMIPSLQMRQKDKASKSILFTTCRFSVKYLLPQDMT